MRVISGALKGKRLKPPIGEQVRPTTDRIKEAIFSIIQFEIPGACVLDLFCGTGQFGIEALSRGAERAVFVDESKTSIQLAVENIKSCRLESETKVHIKQYDSYIKSANEKFDIVFLDPPYGKGMIQNALQLISQFDLLCENGIIVCERDIHDTLDENYGQTVRGREYFYGQTAVTIYRKIQGV